MLPLHHLLKTRYRAQSARYLVISKKEQRLFSLLFFLKPYINILFYRRRIYPLPSGIYFVFFLFSV